MTSVQNRKIKKAVFPVGGLGTRFLPATKALPKEMLPIASKPLIQHAFEEAVKAGIEQFIFITGRNKNIITNHFDTVYELESFLSEKDKHDALSLTRDWVPNAGNIAFIRQQQPLGLGHAVWCARHFIQDEPFAVLLADELFISDKSDSVLGEMIDIYDKTPGNILAVANVAKEKTQNYGIIKPASDDGVNITISDMVEKPKPEFSPSNISIVGRYILEPNIFTYLEKTPKGSNGEIQLTDAIKQMIPNCPTFGYRFGGKRLDCGNHIGFLEANIEFAIRDNLIATQARELIKKIASNL
jgi:UTP--glucose-1-phosphate uridylyltransferase